MPPKARTSKSSTTAKRATKPSAGSADPPKPNLKPTNELIAEEWKKNRMPNRICLRKILFKPDKIKRKPVSGIKLVRCPFQLYNGYFPEGMVENLKTNYSEENERIEKNYEIAVYEAVSEKNKRLLGCITDGSDSCSRNGIFITLDTTSGHFTIYPWDQKADLERDVLPPEWDPSKRVNSLQVFQLCWFMDHPFFVTLVLTTIADNSILPVKKQAGFLTNDYESTFDHVIRSLSKTLRIVPRCSGIETTGSLECEKEAVTEEYTFALVPIGLEYQDQMPFSINWINIGALQPKPKKKAKALKVVHVTALLLKINEKRLVLLKERIEMKTRQMIEMEDKRIRNLELAEKFKDIQINLDRKEQPAEA